MPNFEIKEVLKVLGKRNNGKEVRLTRISWYGKPAQYDLRNWDGDIALNGIALNDNMMLMLHEFLHEYYDKTP